MEKNDELLDAVLEISEARREDFLSEKCIGDDDLKSEVLSLLKAQNGADKFLENSAINLMAKEIAQKNGTEIHSLVGKKLGTYKIEKQIGARRAGRPTAGKSSLVPTAAANIKSG